MENKFEFDWQHSDFKEINQALKFISTLNGNFHDWFEPVYIKTE